MCINDDCTMSREYVPSVDCIRRESECKECISRREYVMKWQREHSYPVPTLIRRCGWADGYFQQDAEGWITWGVYDFPLHDGSFMA